MLSDKSLASESKIVSFMAASSICFLTCSGAVPPIVFLLSMDFLGESSGRRSPDFCSFQRIKNG